MQITVIIEMEAWNTDGSENDQLWEIITIEAKTEEQASEQALEQDFGVRTPTGYTEIKQ